MWLLKQPAAVRLLDKRRLYQPLSYRQVHLCPFHTTTVLFNLIIIPVSHSNMCFWYITVTRAGRVMCEMISSIVSRRKMNPSCLGCVLLHHDCLHSHKPGSSDCAHHGFLPGSTAHSECMMGNHLSLVLHATQNGLKLPWFNDCASVWDSSNKNQYIRIL